MNQIDFVVMWVDGNDPVWRKEKKQYLTNSEIPDVKASSAEKCFRDWDILQYWFRGVEKFSPWVHKIHFVTFGHLPKWLNTQCSKLNIVKHSDFMPTNTLPTFNSRALELNLHRIKGLANQFVYFNDDMFLISPVKPCDFFQNKKPCDCAILSPIHPLRYGTAAIQVNDMEIVNSYFNGFSLVKNNISKWINFKYGIQLLRTMMFFPMRQMIGIYEPHLPASYLKTTFETVWNLESALLANTTDSRFKQKDNVNQWLMRYWQIASGDFVPRSPSFGKFYDISKDIVPICNTIKQQKRKIICINDSSDIKNMNQLRRKLVNAFDLILPEKSSFEL